METFSSLTAFVAVAGPQLYKLIAPQGDGNKNAPSQGCGQFEKYFTNSLPRKGMETADVFSDRFRILYKLIAPQGDGNVIRSTSVVRKST